MTFKFGKASETNRRGVDQRLIEISDLALQITPIDFGIPALGGVRSFEDQKNLVKDGKSKTLNSKHLTGQALDFYAFVDGEASWNECHLAMIGASMLQAANLLGYKIKWGGLWKNFKDYPHIELVGL